MDDAGEEEVQFALTPGQYRDNQVIDYSDLTNTKLFSKATASLEQDFDLKAASLRVFLKNLNQRGDSYGWGDILQIPDDIEADEDDQELIHLVHQHGRLSLQQVRAHAATYVRTETRAAQDSYMLAMCILNTLTESAKATVALYKDDYMFGKIYNGTCLLKVVIRESYIDTKTTIRIIRNKLENLNKYIVEVDSDIVKFNVHVDELLKELHSRGATTNDLLSNLFGAYAEASDKNFVKYIQGKKYDDGEGNITAKSLMSYASTKYKIMVECELWNAPTENRLKWWHSKPRPPSLKVMRKSQVEMAQTERLTEEEWIRN